MNIQTHTNTTTSAWPKHTLSLFLSPGQIHTRMLSAPTAVLVIISITLHDIERRAEAHMSAEEHYMPTLRQLFFFSPSADVRFALLMFELSLGSRSENLEKSWQKGIQISTRIFT